MTDSSAREAHDPAHVRDGAPQSSAIADVRSLHDARLFLQYLLTAHGRLSVRAVILMLVAGLLNGCGILLLIPMLSAAGIGSVDDQLPEVVTRMNKAAAQVGIPITLEIVLVVFVVLTTANALLTWWQSITVARFREDVVYTLRIELYAAIHQTSWTYFVSQSRARFTHALTDNLKRVAVGTIQVLRLLSSVVVTTIQLSAAFVIAPMLCLVVLACGLTLWPLLHRFQRSVATAGFDLTRLNRHFHERLSCDLDGLKEIRSVGGEQSRVREIKQQSQALGDAQRKLARSLATTATVYTIGGAVLLSGLIYLSRHLLQTSPASLIAVIVVFSRTFPRLREIHTCVLYVLQSLPAFKATRDLIEECHQHAGPDTTSNQPISLTNQVAFRNVSFRYHSSQPDILKELNLVIPTGGVTAITGPSGVGKSTLADLLLTLIEPDSGAILIDGEVLRPQHYENWRDQISYVPQETVLFPDTIRNNLLWSRPEATEDELLDALRMSAADEFVNRLPEGLETPVGDRGTCLSGGERQRIALARALLRQPKLLILDEATSALDADNAKRIEQAVTRIRDHVTVLMITHQSSMLNLADRVLKLSMNDALAGDHVSTDDKRAA